MCYKSRENILKKLNIKKEKSKENEDRLLKIVKEVADLKEKWKKLENSWKKKKKL